MPPWAMISCVPGFPLTSRSSSSAIGGSPRPPWMRIGTRRSAASAKTALEALVVQVERLRPGMELDAAGAEVEAARRLGDRLGGQVEADERDEDAVARLGGRERPVVRGPEGGLAIGLVQAEGEGALDVRPREVLEQHVERADHPVDVGSDVDVRVEELGSGRQAGAELLLVLLYETACPLQNLVHPVNLPGAATIGSRA